MTQDCPEFSALSVVPPASPQKQLRVGAGGGGRQGKGSVGADGAATRSSAGVGRTAGGTPLGMCGSGGGGGGGGGGGVGGPQFPKPKQKQLSHAQSSPKRTILKASAQDISIPSRPPSISSSPSHGTNAASVAHSLGAVLRRSSSSSSSGIGGKTNSLLAKVPVRLPSNGDVPSAVDMLVEAARSAAEQTMHSAGEAASTDPSTAASASASASTSDRVFASPKGEARAGPGPSKEPLLSGEGRGTVGGKKHGLVGRSGRRTSARSESTGSGRGGGAGGAGGGAGAGGKIGGKGRGGVARLSLSNHQAPTEDASAQPASRGDDPIGSASALNGAGGDSNGDADPFEGMTPQQARVARIRMEKEAQAAARNKELANMASKGPLTVNVPLPVESAPMTKVQVNRQVLSREKDEMEGR